MLAKIAIPLMVALLPALAGDGFAAPDNGAAAAAAKPEVPISVTAVAGAEGRFTVLWRLQPTPGWHLYSDLRNDTGFPPALTWTLPEGWSAGPLRWPAPERSVTAGEILDHVYEGELILLQEVAVPGGALARGPVTIPARWDWLACRDLCVPGRTETEAVFAAGPADAAQIEALARARAALPVTAPDGGVQAVWSDAAVTLTVPGAVRLEFYPAIDCARLVDAVHGAVRDGAGLTLGLRPGTDGFGPVRGILHQQLSDGRSRDWIVDLPFGG